MDNLLGFIAEARGGENRWVKYGDRPNLRRAMALADAAVARFLGRVGYVEYTGRQRYEHKVVLGTACRRPPGVGSGGGFAPHQLIRNLRRFDAMTEALTEAGILFTWERTGCIRVLDGEELRAEKMRRLQFAAETASGEELARLEAQMVAMDAEIPVAR